MKIGYVVTTHPFFIYIPMSYTHVPLNVVPFSLCLAVRHANLSHAVLKVSSVAHGSVLDVGSVIIYGVDAVMQKLRYLAAVSYAETYESEYANGCIERLVVGRQDVAFGLEQRIEVVHKRREQLEKSGVEGGVQLVSLFAGELGGACQLSQFGVLSVFDALYDLLANVFQLVNVD